MFFFFQNNQFAYRDLLNIMEYRLDKSHRAVLNSQARWPYNFLLVRIDQQMAYTVYVRTIEVKEQIMKAIADAQWVLLCTFCSNLMNNDIYIRRDNIQPKSLSYTNHNFELHTFATPVQCAYCCKYLKGLIFQGYLCHKCNCAVDKACIQFSGKCGVPSIR